MKKRLICTLLAIMVSGSVCASAAESYITPMSSGKVTWDEGADQYNQHFSGGAGTNAGFAVVDGENCYYLGDNNSKARGIGFGSDIIKKNAQGVAFDLCGKGTLTFDMMMKRTSDISSDVKSALTIKGTTTASNVTIGDSQIVCYQDNYTIKVKNDAGNWIDKNPTERYSYGRWYTFEYIFDVVAGNYDINIYEKGGTTPIKTFDTAFLTSVGTVASVNKIVPARSDTSVPAIYLDNWYTTRETFTAATPVITDGTNAVSAAVAITSESGIIDKSPVLLLATYDNTGKLLSANFTVKTITPRGETATTTVVSDTVECTVDKAEGATEARAFVWNNFGQMCPYISPVTTLSLN